MSDEQEEAEANEFAMHLLIPTNLLLAELKKIKGIDLGGDGNEVKLLANKFKVPVAAMAVRIGQVTGRVKP